MGPKGPAVVAATIALCLLAHAAHAQQGRTCKQGFVWREAFAGDYACVTPETRAQAAADNRQASARREPGGGAYGPDTCRQGFVWREARPGDHVCVTPATRDQTAADNRNAGARVAANPSGQGQSKAASGSCTIYEHRDFAGAHWVLRSGDVMRMIRQPDVGTSDGIHRFIYQPSWNDKVSSFKVDPGCTLTLWEHINYGGAHFRATKSRSFVGDSWNDKASEAVCECKGLPNL